MTASAAAEMTGSRVVVPLDGPLSLDALARSINEHHRLAGSYARATLEHVVACGEALMEARTQVPEGQWRAWLRENVTLDTATVAMYVRLATFAGELRSAGVTSVQAAREYVREHDLTVSISNTGRGLSREVVLEVRTLLEAGVPGRQVARQLGIGHTSVDRIRSGERHRDDQPSRRAPRAPRVGITDEMIEGMARWLCAKFPKLWPRLTDDVRHHAVEALNAALRKGSA